MIRVEPLPIFETSIHAISIGFTLQVRSWKSNFIGGAEFANSPPRFRGNSGQLAYFFFFFCFLFLWKYFRSIYCCKYTLQRLIPKLCVMLYATALFLFSTRLYLNISLSLSLLRVALLQRNHFLRLHCSGECGVSVLCRSFFRIWPVFRSEKWQFVGLCIASRFLTE